MTASRPGGWSWSDDRGAALITALMVSLLLVGAAGVLVPLVSLETMIGANHRRAVEAHYAAEAAVAIVTAEVQQGTVTFEDVLGGAARSPHWFGGMNADALPADLHRRTEALRHDPFGRGLDWRLYGAGSLAALVSVPHDYRGWTVVVWVADDAADPDEDPVVDANGLIDIHVSAFDGAGTERALQVTLGAASPTRRAWRMVP